MNISLIESVRIGIRLDGEGVGKVSIATSRKAHFDSHPPFYYIHLQGAAFHTMCDAHCGYRVEACARPEPLKSVKLALNTRNTADKGREDPLREAICVGTSRDSSMELTIDTLRSVAYTLDTLR